ncbi:hypothetical protein GOBAR_AA13585 [Gossypium barbadense]|uniref:Uncharacterized protein n=1 Tax=Gossypium barbadense TaxID=3634 RepID=A0A2P5XUN3_GOSBA|nr:hypothetical protein GOBAR_AA13585 [Gossypium barbadense]
MEIEGDHLNHSTKTNNMVQTSLQEMSLKEAHESFSSYSRGPIHEDRRLQFEKLDEWQTVLLDATDPHIVATTSNEEIPLTVLSIVPFGMIKVSHPKFVTFKVPCHLHKETKPLYLLRRREREHNLSRVQPWKFVTLSCTSYNPSSSKASVLPPSLRYLHAILAHTITGRRESTGIINTHDAYFLWCMSHGHVIDLAYFITLTIQHQMERPRKGVISIGPYVTRLARHFRLLSTAAQESSLTLIGQMSPQGILSMLSMRMIERRRETYPPQYRLA